MCMKYSVSFCALLYIRVTFHEMDNPVTGPAILQEVAAAG